MKAPRVRQIAGAGEIEKALGCGEDVRLLLVQEDARREDVSRLVLRARELGIPVRTATRNVVSRLCRVRPVEEVLALVGRDPDADLEDSLARRGATGRSAAGRAVRSSRPRAPGRPPGRVGRGAATTTGAAPSRPRTR